jgi:predicted SprT family Zn-dependent metalloprotease
MLKIYAWEHRIFKDMYDIWILPEHKERVTRALAKHFGITLNHLQFTKYHNAEANGYLGLIKLPRKACQIGLIIHELAHLYNYQYNGQRGHRKAFKKSLIKLMVESKYILDEVL